MGDDEQHELENILLENPRKGAVIEGLAGIRKLRIKLEGRGKSGGGRVIYLDVLEKEKRLKNICQTDRRRNIGSRLAYIL